MNVAITTSGAFVRAALVGTLGLADIAALLAALDAAARRGRFVLLTDTTRGDVPRALLRDFAAGLKDAPHVEPAWLGDAVVVTSPALRFLLSTLLLIAPLPTEVKTFATDAAARAWCAELLMRHDIDVPPELILVPE